jgi:hypothetical protein
MSTKQMTIAELRAALPYLAPLKAALPYVKRIAATAPTEMKRQQRQRQAVKDAALIRDAIAELERAEAYVRYVDESWQ